MNPSHVRLGATILACLLVLAFLGRAGAEIPRIISYQGRVTDSGGSAIADGTYDMAFKLFDAVTGGTQKWESGTVSITVTDGIFSVLLGESPQIPILLQFTEDLWLEVVFDGVTQSPRHRMSSVGYAYMASGLVPGTKIEEAMFGEVLWVKNQNLTGASDGIIGKTQSTIGYGVTGNAEATSGSTRGVYGRCYSADGRGIFGYNSANSGTARGVYGETSSPQGEAVAGVNFQSSGGGKGVYGRTYSAGGYGVYGYASATTGVNYGGYFETASTSGSGLRGVAPATTGVTYGVYGRVYSSSDGTRGVYGRSYGTTGASYGVIGRSDSDEGYGVYGVASANTGSAIGGGFESDNGHGVAGWASANSGLAYGVYGYTHSPGGRGVAGFNSATTGDEAYGVYGRAMSPTTAAGFFENIAASSGTGVIGMGVLQGGIFHDVTSGNWAACGRSSYKVYGTGSVNFVQNHPHNSDQVIVYAAPEGDEVATYTRGTARLINGVARVSLGETFQWVTNPDIGLTAHLTPRGSGSVLYVKSIDTKEIVVQSLEGFPDDVLFDYLVYGLRIGFEEHSVVQEKDLDAAIPSMADHLDLYTRRPELRQYNALEKFRSINVSNVLGEHVGSTDTYQLRNLIGVQSGTHATSIRDAEEGIIYPHSRSDYDGIGDEFAPPKSEDSSEAESARAIDERR